MATTSVEYSGDGGATKNFTFPSLQQSDIKVSVDNVLKTVSTHYNITGYTSTGGGSVVFTSGNIPSSGTIRIFRDTDVDTAKSTYVAGSSITALDLNDNHKQSLFKLQEQANTTFSTTDQAKLNGIETGATADQTASEIRTLVESASDSNVFTDADHSKLNAIEASADVTDATNVDAAGAVMNSDTTTAAMSFVVDEDNMSSNSATKLPTQQSVKAYVDTEVAGVVNSAPGTLDTLNELAAALGDDANFSTTVTNSIATKLPLAGGTMTGNIVMSGSQTVDGRDLSVDGSKLDGIETGATADQTNAEIRAAVEAATDSNVFTDADHTKLNGIEASATADQTDAEIRAAVEAATDSNVFTDADHTKLNGIEAGATADQTASEILTSIKTVDGSGSGLDADTVDGIQASSFVRSDANDTATGQLTLSGGISTNGKDVYTGNGALVAHDAAGAFVDPRSGGNIDHIWHKESNDATDTGWNFVSDGTYKQTGNANINVGSINGNSFTTFKYHGAVGNGTTDDSTAVTNALATGKVVNGDGLIYKVSAVPTDFKNIRNAAFKVGTHIHPSKDFFSHNCSKITNNRAYTAWAQDKAYVANNQIKVWSNYGDAHKDGVRRPICFISDDGGNSYPETTLLDDPRFEKLEAMSAGTDEIYEYVFASRTSHNVDINDANIGSVTHYMYRRPVAVKRVQKEIATGDVNINNDTITITNHGYGTGLEVKYNDEDDDDTTYTGIGGLSNTHYFVIRVDANTIKLASSLTNAEAGTAINLTTQGNNSQTITPYAGTYQRWKRYTLDLPVSPYGSPAIKPIFQHSFAAGNGFIVTGGTNGSGSFLIYSNNHGESWISGHSTNTSSNRGVVGLGNDGNYEEPTVRYDSSTSKFYAFSRGGDANGSDNMAYHLIPHALASSPTVTTHVAPTSFWNGAVTINRVQDSPVPFVIKDGYIHAFCSLRGTNTDERPDSFYIKHQLSDGENIWSFAELYNLGELLQLEKGSLGGTGGQNGVPAGASGVGVGSALVYNDKIMFFYSSEERSQADESPDQDLGVDKIVNLYQFVLNDTVKYGVNNYVDNFVEDRSSNNRAKLIPDTTPDNANRQSWWQSHGNFIFSKTRSFCTPHINSRTDPDNFNHFTGSQLAAFDSYTGSGEVSIFGGPSSSAKFGFTVYNTDAGGATGFICRGNQDLELFCGGEVGANFTKDGAAELYFNNTSKFATTNTGVSVTGNIDLADNGKLVLGAGDGTNGDLEIYHDGSNNYIDCPAAAGTGHLIIRGDDVFIKGSNDEHMIKAIENSGVELFHNNSSKFYTMANGCVISGRLGLGTETSPSFPLDIKGPDNTLAYLESTDQHAYILMKDSIGNILIGTDSGHFRLSQTDTNGTVVETVRVKADGKVGIGTTNPSSRVEIRDSSASHQLVSINRANSDVAALFIGNNSSNNPIIAANNADLLVGRDLSGTFTEYYRVNNSSGHIQIHQSSSTEPGAGNTVEGACFNRDSTDGTCLYLSKTDAFCLHLNRVNSGDIQIFRRQGIQKGQININASQVAYETTSDYRLKENVVSISDGISKLKALKPSRFNFKEDPTNTIDGFLAHEVQTVVPNAVSGTKDGVDENGDPKYQGMDSSLLVPLLTAALQEAVAKIETLETKVAALEAK